LPPENPAGKATGGFHPTGLVKPPLELDFCYERNNPGKDENHGHNGEKNLVTAATLFKTVVLNHFLGGCLCRHASTSILLK
jgi:hypothetical protein